MKILITGALGHIGSKLFRQLSEDFPAATIYLIDNLSTQRYCSLFSVNFQNIKFIEADILKDDLNSLIKDTNYVIHLAALTDAAKSIDSSENVEETNFRTSTIIADLCAKNNIPLIFISTTSVYKGINVTLDENSTEENLEGSTPYAKSKLNSEKYLMELAKTSEFKFSILRFGTIVGPSNGMRFHTAVNKFIWDIFTKGVVAVWRTALHQKRPYLSLTDGVNAISFLISQNLFNNSIYNVVSSNFTVNEILDLIKINIENFEISLVDNKAMNELSFAVDGQKLIDLGFQYRSSIEEEIKETSKLFFKC